MSAAELQIAARTGEPVTAVRKALWQDRTLVKTWLMRGTLHLIPSDDLPIYTAAMRGSWIRTRRSWLDYVQMTESELMSLIDDIGRAMDGTPMTREHILARVASGRSDHVKAMLRSSWGGMLKPVARQGLLCFGPNQGQTVTFVNPHDWLGSWRDVDPDVAIAEVARRYLRAYGPATKTDFARWWGNWAGAGQAAWSAIASDVVMVSVEGELADILASDVAALRDARLHGSVALLPAFDPYLMGHSSRKHLFELAHAIKVSRTAGWISAVVLVDGRVEGTWKHTVRAGTFRVEVSPFRRLGAPVVATVRKRVQALAESAGARASELVVVR